MKKMLGLLTAFMLIGTLSFAQDTANSVSESAVKAKCCKAAATCAKAMGMSIAECKKICGDKTASSSVSNTDAQQLGKAQLVSQKIEETSNATLQNISPKKCTKKSKMSDAECQKSSGSKSGNQNASNVKLVTQKKAAAKCCKASKCCKKG